MSSELAQKLYANQNQAEGAGSKAGEDSSDGNEDVMDAEFEEVKEESK